MLTAAENRVETAEAHRGVRGPREDPEAVARGVERARRPGTSCSRATRAATCTTARRSTSRSSRPWPATTPCRYADPVIAGGTDVVAPTVWMPQRLPWNPGGYGGGSLWGYPGGSGAVMSQDFHVWTFVYDVSGVASVVLKYRVDDDGANPMTTDVNETYAGGAGVGAWQSVPMTFRDFPAGNVWNDPGIDFSEMPQYFADQYSAQHDRASRTSCSTTTSRRRTPSGTSSARRSSTCGWEAAAAGPTRACGGTRPTPRPAARSPSTTTSTAAACSRAPRTRSASTSGTAGGRASSRPTPR